MNKNTVEFMIKNGVDFDEIWDKIESRYNAGLITMEQCYEMQQYLNLVMHVG